MDDAIGDKRFNAISRHSFVARFAQRRNVGFVALGLISRIGTLFIIAREGIVLSNASLVCCSPLHESHVVLFPLCDDKRPAHWMSAQLLVRSKQPA